MGPFEGKLHAKNTNVSQTVVEGWANVVLHVYSCSMECKKPASLEFLQKAPLGGFDSWCVLQLMLNRHLSCPRLPPRPPELFVKWHLRVPFVAE